MIASLLLSLVPSLPVPAEEVRPDAVLLRYPDVSATQVVFRYADDLWIAPRTGGSARRLTSAPGPESMPKFSPDGRRVAFVGGYDGGSDLYVLDVAAGVPERVTHHPTQEILCDWTPDGEGLLFWSSEISGQRRAPRLFTVPAAGGQPTPLPVPYGGFGAIDDSGRWLAYTTATREFRTWKRYAGGLSQDVWLFDLETHASRLVTGEHPGTDAIPMWHGGEVVFLSDRGEYHRMNLYAFDVERGTTRRLTDFRRTDVKFPSMGPQDVVFAAGGKLYRYEFATGDRVPIEITIPGERPALRAQLLDLAPFLTGATPGPSGARVLVEARGELFDVPVEEGVTRNLTRSDGTAERDPAWSPDGRWQAFFSDRSGEYELWLRRADGQPFEGADDQGERRLTDLGPGWKFSPVFSPDSERIAFATNDGGLWLCERESGATRRVHTNPEGEPLRVAWSPDSAWLAWNHRHPESRLSALYLYDVEADAVQAVTSGAFDDREPVFDRGGDWLFFVSSRTFDPIYEDLGTTWIYTNTHNLLAVPLRADVEDPFALEDPREELADEETSADEESAAAEETAAEPAADGEAEAGEEAGEESGEEEQQDDSVVIELAGFEARAMVLPVPAGELGQLAAGEGKIFFVRRPRTGSAGGEPRLEVYELGEDEPQTVLEGLTGYELTADGEKLLVARGTTVAVVDAKPGAEFEAIDLGGLVARIHPRAEWHQMLADVYRLYRDFFYDPGLHGVDWDGLYARYDAALADATSRGDLHWFIGEMIAELNVGHAYNRGPRGGLSPRNPARPVGLLGCDWELSEGAYRIARILGDAGPYDADARSPLAVHGIDARVGDWLLAVNGVPVDGSRDVYAAFEGTAGRTTELTLNTRPVRDGNERTVLVKPLASEAGLRYRDWVSRKRAFVHEKSGGRVGYVHVPDTGRNGQNELVRQLLGEMHRDALLVDERWNAGGQIPTRFIELLNRPVTNYWALRHGEDWVWPPVGHRGPKAMLINEWAGSGGDAFPYYFRQAGLGPLIGKRTWGGLVGISGNPALIDGAAPTVPRFAFYELDGTWGVEGFGVPPDIEVIDDPALMADGGDPQLERGVEVLLEELAHWSDPRPARPASPDRTGQGVPDEDH